MTKEIKKEVRKFDAEVGKVLHLMIHSLYGNKEVAIRELVSNASDACDKLKFLSQTDSSVLGADSELKIKISVDKEKRIVTIFDNGTGMDEKDLSDNLGTIARSGTAAFAEKLTGDAKNDSHLIGQFGVGFYSAFMIADQISVITRKYDQAQAYNWLSDGQGEYSISPVDCDFERGTEIQLHIKEDESEYLDHFKLKHIIKSYSDHIAVPILFCDESGNENQVNSSSALWRNPKSEISEEQYKDFYKTISYSNDDPWLTIHNKNEGAVEYSNLLYIPSSKTFDLFHPDRKCRVKLYIKRVFIADEKIDIIPSYLRFLRGVVDSEDLPLNISRETLQYNRTLEKIKNSITSRVLGELKKKLAQDKDSYLLFWNNFGAALKEGLCEATSQHEKLLEVCIFKSALTGEMITLDQYIENAKDRSEDLPKEIYFLSGDDQEKLLNSPQIEGFLKKNIDVLLFTDTVDDFWVNVNHIYKDFAIKSVTRSDINLEDEDKKQDKTDEKETKTDKLIEFFKETLGDLVKDVKLSKKLTSSPSCLAVADGAMDIRMERFLLEQKQIQKSTAKILEINPNHKIIQVINDKLINDKIDDGIKDLIFMLYDQACIIEGEPVNDSNLFTKRLNNIIEQSYIS